MDLNPKILYRFFNGTYSRRDYNEVKAIFLDYDKRFKLRGHLLKHWNEIVEQGLPEDNVDHLLDKIHVKLREEKQTFKTHKFISVFQRIAAILIVPLILTFLVIEYFPVSETKMNEIVYAEIQCPLGVRTKFNLPDGTIGFLNSGSTLKYPVDFVNKRKVDLVGEAFFDVTHDKQHPFIVHTPNLNIKVLGTSFNVIAYKNEYKEEVILNNGRVDITSIEGEEITVLQPNQKLVLNTQNSKFDKSEVEAIQYVGWTEGKLVFRNEGLKLVAERLGRWYNVEIEIQDTELLKYAFRATFIDEPIEEVLKLLALTAPLSFQEQPRMVIDDNIYEKRKIIVVLDRKRLKAFN